MKDRLTKIVKDSIIKNIDYSCRLAENITDDLLANGAILPPCKIGDAVYCIRHDEMRKPYVKRLEVHSIIMWRNKTFSVFTTKEDFWNRTAFTTKEEAEKAIAERRLT